jgi:hypothetical protein
MTLAEIEKLTDEEANQRVAELLGWKAVVINAAEEGDDDFTRLEDPDSNEVAFQWGECDLSDFLGSLQKWCSDLNACAEMETTSLNTVKLIAAYETALLAQSTHPMKTAYLWHTPARQRVNSFLVVMLP